MPIPVVCGNCQTRLNAPDAAAGRKVKCPKCQTVMAVPALAEPPPPPPAAGGGSPFEFGGESPPPPPRRSSAAPRPAASPPEPEPEAPPAGGGAAFDFGGAVSSAEPTARSRGDRRRPRDDGDAPADDDRPRRRRPRDDDAPADDDRPRGRGGQPGGKKFPVGLVIGIAGAALLMCCGGPLGVYFFAIQPKLQEAIDRVKAENDAKQKQIDDEMKRRADGGGDTGAGGATSSVPTGWKEFRAKDGSFKGYFPATPKEEAQPQKGPKGSTPTVKQYMAEVPNDDVMAGLIVMKFPTGASAAQKTTTMEFTAGAFAMLGGGKSEPKEVTWLGHKGKEMQMKEPGGDGEMVIRSVLNGNTGYVGVVGFKGGRKQDLIDGFFNNIEATSK